MLVAVVKVTTTLDVAVNGTAVEVVKPVTAVVLPNAAPVTGPTLRKSLDVATEKYWHGAAMMAPRVKPARVTVYGPKGISAEAVRTTCVVLVWPALTAKAAADTVTVGVTPEVI